MDARVNPIGSVTLTNQLISEFHRPTRRASGLLEECFSSQENERGSLLPVPIRE